MYKYLLFAFTSIFILFQSSCSTDDDSPQYDYPYEFQVISQFGINQDELNFWFEPIEEIRKNPNPEYQLFITSDIDKEFTLKEGNGTLIDSKKYYPIILDKKNIQRTFIPSVKGTHNLTFTFRNHQGYIYKTTFKQSFK